jgi:hypothetical protein
MRLVPKTDFVIDRSESHGQISGVYVAMALTVMAAFVLGLLLGAAL